MQTAPLDARRLLAGVALALLPSLGHAGQQTCAPTLATENAAMSQASEQQAPEHLRDFDVVELRRYTVSPGQRARFAAWFDAYFPEAFEQLGAMVFGQFLERGASEHFFWLRGYRDMLDRPVINSAFYYGPLWREHRTKVNAILPDSDDVLLMRVVAGHPVPVLPAMDPVDEPAGAHGRLVVQLLPVPDGRADAVVAALADAATRYPHDGVLDAGLLRTLDAANNFPQLPVRMDGTWVAWIGLARDGDAAARLEAAMDAFEQRLDAAGDLRAPAERIVADPTPRSRLRWLDAGAHATVPR
ncbi:MAG: NIPSNAP family protein [Luteimonas sp.]